MKKVSSASCDWKKSHAGGKEIPDRNRSRLYRYKGNYSWRGVRKERYKKEEGAWSDIVRNTLIGNHRETAKFHLRYFEIAPNGQSSLETHKHEHVVIGIRGKGICLVGKNRHHINFLDTLYVEPNLPHRLSNPFNEPFGFFCIVNSKRDRPKALKG